MVKKQVGAKDRHIQSMVTYYFDMWRNYVNTWKGVYLGHDVTKEDKNTTCHGFCELELIEPDLTDIKT